MDENVKIKINEIQVLLEELNVKGNQNVIILSNVFSRLQFVIQEINKGIVIDNTIEKEE